MSTAKKPLAKFEVQQKYPPKEKEKKKKMVEDFVILNNYNDHRMTDVKRECQQKMPLTKPVLHGEKLINKYY